MADELTVYRPPGLLPPRPVLFMPGWGFDGRILRLAADLPWLAPLGLMSPEGLSDRLHAWLAAQRIESVDLVGWSMGGYCALDFVRRFPEKVASLTLLAVRTHWPVAEIEELAAELAAAPKVFLTAFYRKCFLGYKEAYQRFVAELQPAYLEMADPAALQAGLMFLAGFKMPGQVSCETSCYHGRRDVVAPLSERALLHGARSITLEHGGHPLFLDPAFLRPGLERKKAIRQRFSKAAASYDRHADVQAELAAALADALTTAPPPHAILELGCGTGSYTVRLAGQFPEARLICLDFSETMLAQARQKTGERDRIAFLCADAEHFLAAGRGSFELITSNATLQWFENPASAFAGIRSLLAPGGIFWASIFGRDTLGELEAGLRHAFGGTVHVPANRFLSLDEVTDLAAKMFDQVEVREQRITRHYATLTELLFHFQKTGTGGWHAGAAFWGKRQRQALDSWFREQNGGYRVTYQVFMVHCR